MHYLDNAATTRPCAEAVEVAARCMTEDFGNPSSLHAVGRSARVTLARARAEVASVLQARPEEIVFTSGGTEACNLALLGPADSLRRWGRHIVVSALEHSAVSEPMKVLRDKGFKIAVAPPDVYGRITPEAVVQALTPETSLISVILISNETGAVNPVGEIVKAARLAGCGALFHTDAVQALCKTDCTPRALGVDLLTVSAHKIGGIKGAGALWRAPGVRLTPLLRGGDQETGHRSGTEALPALAAFGAACRVRSETLAHDIDHMNALKKRLLAGLDGMEGVAVIPPHDAPHIVSLAVPGYPSEIMLRFLSDRAVYVSPGSACRKGRRSEVLTAMGLPVRSLDSALRISLSPDNQEADIEALLAGLRIGMDTLAHN